MERKRNIAWAFMGMVLASVLVLALACGGEEAPTPRPTARPQPTAMPQATQLPSSGTSMMGDPVYGGTLRYVGAPAFKTTDPAFAVGDPITLVHYLLFNQIVKLGDNLDIVPELAEGWEVGGDNMSVTFNLRTGVKFQDGTLMTAESIKYNLDRCLDDEVPCISKTKIEQIDSVDVVDNYTFRVNLKNPYRPILAALAEIAGFMSSPTAIQQYNSYGDVTGDYGKFPTGTGPFILDEWVPERSLTLTRFDDYWEEGKPYLDAIRFIPLPEGTSGIAMLRTGETDIMEIQPTELPLLEGHPDVRVEGYESGRVWNMGVNIYSVPDKKVRQAMAYSMDRQTFIDTVFEGAGRPAYSVVGQGFAHDPNLEPFKFNREKARSLLAEAGYDDSIEIEFMTRGTSPWQEIAEAFQAMMEPSGINIKIDVVSRASYTPRRLDADFQVLPSYRTPLGDPHLLLGELFQEGGRGNYGRYSNPEVDRLLLQAGAIFDTAEAAKLYRDAQAMILDDVPIITYRFSTEYAAMNNKVGNFKRTPDLDLKLRDLWLEQ
jgi:peptide/nickel transport system substrate-binding protein